MGSDGKPFKRYGRSYRLHAVNQKRTNYNPRLWETILHMAYRVRAISQY